MPSEEFILLVMVCADNRLVIPVPRKLLQINGAVICAAKLFR